jgi:hypothetical protein
MDETILAFLHGYVQHLDAHAGPAVQSDWHPQGALSINSEPHPPAFPLGRPTFVGFEIGRGERDWLPGSQKPKRR